jgi:hypothetical protein
MQPFPVPSVPYLDALDPQDVDMFVWDFSAAAFPGDMMVSVSISSEPAGLSIATPLLIGQVAQVLIGPAALSPLTYELEVSATFASGRVLDGDIAISVEPL